MVIQSYWFLDILKNITDVALSLMVINTYGSQQNKDAVK